ncbi:hypothetical protein [Neptunicella sp. SCSIO 80796]|uniref:hypothetical protein n=1 Tax=Neptunicella plasticusilytica TaxID=3117012 RepID=UPI003A4E448D
MDYLFRVAMHGLRWLCVGAIGAILLAGFWFELSIAQLLIVNPLLLLLAVSLFAYLGVKLDNSSEETADIHHIHHYLPHCVQSKKVVKWKKCG